MIEGVEIKRLKIIPDERGRVMEILRKDDEVFEDFGQNYMTTAYPQVIKAWHLHKKQTDFFTCIKGMIKLVLYDSRENSPTKGEVNQFFVGEHNPILIKIPKEICQVREVLWRQLVPKVIVTFRFGDMCLTYVQKRIV